MTTPVTRAKIGFGVLVVALCSIPAPVSGAPGPTQVTVTNTPLPVQGTISATQSGTWNVGVTGTPNVNVVNTPSVNAAASQSGTWNVGITNNTHDNPFFVRDADNPAKQPVVSTCSATLSGGSASCTFDPVPSGKEMVVEMFTALIDMNIGAKPGSAQFTGTTHTPSGITTQYNLYYPVSLNGTIGTADLWSVSQPLTRAYVDPGNVPGCFVAVSQGIAQDVHCTISGYLVNVP